MNLAYLNLEIFGFMSLISKNAADCLAKLPEGVKGNVKETPWFKDASVLATLHTIDDIDFTFTIPNWVSLKSVFDSAFFNVLFKYRVGKLGSIAASAYCAYLILIGVYQSIPDSSLALCDWVNWIGASFWWGAASFIWPVVCVAAGSTIAYRAKRDLRYNLKNLGKQELTAAVAELGKVEAAVQQTAS